MLQTFKDKAKSSHKFRIYCSIWGTIGAVLLMCMNHTPLVIMTGILGVTGMWSNMLVMSVNGGRMPIPWEPNEDQPYYVKMDVKTTRLILLSDIFYVRIPFLLPPSYMSIGDALMYMCWFSWIPYFFLRALINAW